MKSESRKNEGALAAFAVIVVGKFARMMKVRERMTPSAANNFAVICPFRAYVMRIR